MTDKPTYRLTTPAELAALPPALLGFTPEESIVVISLHTARQVGLTMRYDLADVMEHPEDFPRQVDFRVASDNGDFCVIVLYTEADPMLYAGLMVHVLEGTQHCELGEAVWVKGNRYASYFCDDLDCCPIEGNEFTPSGAVLGVIAESVKEGRQQVRTRSELVAMFVAGEPDAESQRQAEKLLDVRYRDEVLIEVFEADLVLEAAARYTHIARGATGEARDMALTVAATFYYMIGDGTYANCALEAMAGKSSLAKILDDAIMHGVPPTVFPQVIADAKALAARRAAE